jgi:hypothetical protein
MCLVRVRSIRRWFHQGATHIEELGPRFRGDERREHQLNGEPAYNPAP